MADLDLASPRVLRATLARYGLSPRKSLGQNFLIDGNLRDKIVQAASLRPEDLAMEVGPGPGCLTGRLLATGASVLAVETDRGLANVLTDIHPPAPGRFAVVIADVLALNLEQVVADLGFAGRPCVAVANLPYYITTPVIFHLLASKLPWLRMVFLVQREVAARIVAPPGGKDYGLLSVNTRYRAAAEIVQILPASVFWPPPKVQSAVVRLTMRSEDRLPAREERIFFALTQAAFGQRRKTLANACRAFADRMGLSNRMFNDLCLAAGIEPSRRGETLALEEFKSLATRIAGASPPGVDD